MVLIAALDRSQRLIESVCPSKQACVASFQYVTFSAHSALMFCIMSRLFFTSVHKCQVPDHHISSTSSSINLLKMCKKNRAESTIIQETGFDKGVNLGNVEKN